MIQKSFIFETLWSPIIALGTCLIPFGLLIVVFFCLKRKEENRYAVAYIDFLKELKLLAVQANQDAWNGYFNLFNTTIPALRYLYEYKTDVECESKSFKISEGKCRHHREQLMRRMETLENILENLEDEIPSLNEDSSDDKKDLTPIIKYNKASPFKSFGNNSAIS